MSFISVSPCTGVLQGDVSVPGDKSIGHRALLFGALTNGSVRVSGLSSGKDNARSLQAIRQLGVSVDAIGEEDFVIHGVGLRGLSAPTADIDCGNSGTTMRLLVGILAGQRFDSVLVGDESLSSRPMRRVTEPLTAMGARVTGQMRGKEVYPPLRVSALGNAGLHGLEWEQSIASAQVKSTILLAGLYADGATTVVEPGPSRDHTELLLGFMGAPITVDGNRIRLDPTGWNEMLEASTIVVPGDPSSAAFLVAAGLLAGADDVRIRNVCLNRTRCGFLSVLDKLGARVHVHPSATETHEEVGDLVLGKGAGDAMRGVSIGQDLIVLSLDELPILAVVAAQATGITEFSDAKELRFKESDRIDTTCKMLRNLGVEVEEWDDGFRLEGLGGKPFSSCQVQSAGDHRIAMSAVVAGLRADGPVTVHNVDNVATSFPTFLPTLTSLGIRATQG